MSLRQLKPKNNGVVLLRHDFVTALNYLLWSVAEDGNDGNGLTLEKKKKKDQRFQVLNCLERTTKLLFFPPGLNAFYRSIL